MSQVRALADEGQRGFSPPRERRILWLPLTLWLIAIAGACWLDEPVALRIYSSGIYLFARHSDLFRAIKAPGTFYFTLTLALIWWFSSSARLRAAIQVCGSGITAGGFYTVGKWAVARTRPIVGNGIFINRPFELDFFPDGLLGLFASRPDRSFPSGHTCLAFATAMALAIFIPRWRVAFLVIAACVGLERVLEDAHYLSDVVAGAGLGVLAATLTRFLYERAFSQWSPVASSAPGH
jgi:membrane-associated phospholipid phosphatase